MKVGLHGTAVNIPLEAAEEGFRKIGYECEWREGRAFDSRQVEDFDLVVVHGLRGSAGRIREAYRAHNIPVLVMDWGYVRRVNEPTEYNQGHWQLSLNHFGWMPDIDCPSDRWDALGVKPKPYREREGVALVCAQTPGDPSHGMLRPEMQAWLQFTMQKARRHFQEVLYRPHPRRPVEIGEPESHGPIDWDTVSAIITYNSTTGLEAILEGVPVFALGEAHYGAFSGILSRDVCRFKPWTEEELQPYLNKLAYAQWTLDEVATGAPFRFMKENGYV